MPYSGRNTMMFLPLYGRHQGGTNCVREDVPAWTQLVPKFCKVLDNNETSTIELSLPSIMKVNDYNFERDHVENIKRN